MTAVTTDAKEKAPAVESKSGADASTEHKVSTNQIADPAKLMADSKPAASAKTAAVDARPAIDAKSSADANTTTIASVEHSSAPLSPLSALVPGTDAKFSLNTLAPISKTTVPDFLSLDYDFYGTREKSCNATAGGYDLFKIIDPESLFLVKTPALETAPAIKDSGSVKSFFPPGPIAWNSERIDKVNDATVAAFGTVFDETGDAGKVAKYNQIDDAQSEALLAQHKPGESWKGADGSFYKATPNGGLVHRGDNGDVEYYAKDRTFKKDGLNESWSYQGETIEKHVDAQGKVTYRKVFGDGTSTEIVDDKDIKAIHHLENLTVTQHAEPLRDDRRAFDEAHNGVNQHIDGGQDYTKDDASGDRLRKDSDHSYAVLKTKDGKFYAIQNGHVYGFDMDKHSFGRQEVPADKLPPSLKRGADGCLHFGTVSLSSQNEVDDSVNGLKFKDRATHIAAVSYGKPVDISVDGGKETLRVGDRQSVFNAQTDKLAISENGKPNLDFDYKTHVLHSAGITFSPDETSVDEAFSLNERSGAMKFGDGTSWAPLFSYAGSNDAYGSSFESATAQLHATVNEALSLSALINTPGSQESALAQLYSILGKLDGISGGIEIQAAVAVSKGTIGSQIARAEAIGAVNAKLFAAGESNSSIAGAINRRGSGTSDDFIVQQILKHESI